MGTLGVLLAQDLSIIPKAIADRGMSRVTRGCFLAVSSAELLRVLPRSDTEVQTPIQAKCAVQMWDHETTLQHWLYVAPNATFSIYFPDCFSPDKFCLSCRKGTAL